MSSSVLPHGDGVSPARSALGTLVTQQLRVLLERRAIRIAVVGLMLAAASGFTYLPTIRSDPGQAEWVFIIPVAVAAIAAGLREGLITALVAALMAGIFAADKAQMFELGTETFALFSARVAMFGITAAVLGAFAEAHYSVQDHLRQLALLDPLTKVSNIERFHHEVRMLDAAGVPYAVMITDLDNLKALNDEYGHQAGSAAIQTTANVLRRVVRTTDLVARFGGDEFVVILREADRVGAQIVMNRVRKMLREETLPIAPDVVLKVSMGVAISGEDGSTPEELLRNADEAMYSEKRSRKASGEGSSR
ncbi:MAG: GGDEF domain-containing protein [Actinobacteria bacterium]|nr:GGDEF domain-containing protein [Actinomycetota bacterium]